MDTTPLVEEPHGRHAFYRRLYGKSMPVLTSGDSLRIDGFETSERDIVLHFAELPDTNLDRELERLLKLGILAQGSAGTMISAKYVESEFSRLKDKMAQDIDNAFGPEGEIPRMVEKYFGNDGTIRAVLDPDRDGTPLNRLRTAMHADLSEIKDAVAMKRGRSEEAKKGTQKGWEFEEMCEPEICSMADAHSDTVESTGGSAGDLGASKKGDFVVTIGGTERKIVFEMKHRADMTIPEIRKQLNGAMENRRADYAVLVSRNKDALPKEAGWFNEYDGNKLVCAISETDEDEENMWVVRIAYRWARLRVASSAEKELGVDPEAVTQGVREIEASLRRMGTVTAQCKTIAGSAKKIEDVMREEETKIRDKIEDIIHSMNRSGA